MNSTLAVVAQAQSHYKTFAKRSNRSDEAWMEYNDQRVIQVISHVDKFNLLEINGLPMKEQIMREVPHVLHHTLIIAIPFFTLVFYIHFSDSSSVPVLPPGLFVW